MLSFKSTILGATALSLSLAAPYVAQAGIPLPLGTNLTFATGTLSGTPKDYFSNIKPTGWSQAGSGNLMFIDSTSATNQDAAGSVYLTTYADPGNSTVTYTGNYLEADGNPHYESTLYRTLTGLSIGQQYTLSFLQGASEQTTFPKGAQANIPQTTNQWIISLGTSVLKVNKGAGASDPYDNTTNLDTYSNPDLTAATQVTPLMTVPKGQAAGWSQVSVTLTADATTDIISFLAWGDGGSEVNLPPIAFLAGFQGAGVTDAPEPASMALFGVGLAGLGAVARRRRAKAATAN